MGDAEAAIEHAHQILRLSPLDRRMHLTYVLLAVACFVGRRYAEGLEWALRAKMDNQGVFLGRLNATLCLVGVGEIAKAKAEFVEANAIAPAWIEALLQGRSSYARQIEQDRQRIFLRIAAGLEDPSVAAAVR